MGASPQEEVPVIPDARTGRGRKLAAQLLSPFTIIVGVLVIGLAIGLVIDSGAVDSAVVVLVIGLGILLRRAWKRADKQARDAFFFAFAESRLLSDPGIPGFPPVTSLLRTGDHRQTGRLMAGKIDGRRSGSLGHYIIETVTGNNDSERVIFHDFTIVLFEIDGISKNLGRMHFLARSEDDRKADRHPIPASEPLHLESVALARRYGMHTSAGIDQILIRRIFSPSFIVWLIEKPPGGFGFELEGDHLCCYVTRLLDSADELDELISASVNVVDRLLDIAGAVSPV